MARPQTIFVNEPALLAGVAAEIDSRLREIEAALSPLNAEWLSFRHIRTWDEIQRLHRWRDRTREHGVRYNLPAFVGRELTPAERKRHQEAIQRFVHDGLVSVVNRWINLTPVGRARLSSLAADGLVHLDGRYVRLPEGTDADAGGGKLPAGDATEDPPQ